MSSLQTPCRQNVQTRSVYPYRHKNNKEEFRFILSSLKKGVVYKVLVVKSERLLSVYQVVYKKLVLESRCLLTQRANGPDCCYATQQKYSLGCHFSHFQARPIRRRPPDVTQRRPAASPEAPIWNGRKGLLGSDLGSLTQTSAAVSLADVLKPVRRIRILLTASESLRLLGS